MLLNRPSSKWFILAKIIILLYGLLLTSCPISNRNATMNVIFNHLTYHFATNIVISNRLATNDAISNHLATNNAISNRLANIMWYLIV